MADWHCYTHSAEDFHWVSATVVAETAEGAAVIAATKTQTEGDWIVIKMADDAPDPIEIVVHAQTTYTTK